MEIGSEGGHAVRIACGYVNAKNGFGGYTGEQPWYVVAFADGSAGACVGDTSDCGYIPSAPVHSSARASLGQLR